jgi:hypothetical protein
MAIEKRLRTLEAYNEEEKAIKALHRWFETQGVNKLEAVDIMMHASAAVLAAAAVSREKLEDDLRYAAHYFTELARIIHRKCAEAQKGNGRV